MLPLALKKDAAPGGAAWQWAKCRFSLRALAAAQLADKTEADEGAAQQRKRGRLGYKHRSSRRNQEELLPAIRRVIDNDAERHNVGGSEARQTKSLQYLVGKTVTVVGGDQLCAR